LQLLCLRPRVAFYPPPLLVIWHCSPILLSCLVSIAFSTICTASRPYAIPPSNNSQCRLSSLFHRSLDTDGKVDCSVISSHDLVLVVWRKRHLIVQLEGRRGETGWIGRLRSRAVSSWRCGGELIILVGSVGRRMVSWSGGHCSLRQHRMVLWSGGHHREEAAAGRSTVVGHRSTRYHIDVV